jgi:hydrogenase expression/formation protein HypD
VITGSAPYAAIARRHKKPCVITGFEPADILKGIEGLVSQIRCGAHRVVIEYTRAVRPEGNRMARRMLCRVFCARDAVWRGLGVMKKSGLALRPAYRAFDAEKRFKVVLPPAKTHPGCLCGAVLQGLKTPRDCRLFGKACVPRYPVGPCMVSSEGTCAAFYRYEK